VKDAWMSGWRREGLSEEAMREEALAEEGLLCEAIDTYSAAFRCDPRHYYSGINAVTLHHLHAHLAGDAALVASSSEMEGGVRWAIRSALLRESIDNRDYWAHVSMADLEILTAETSIVERCYRDAVAVVDGNWFDLDSSRQQLMILRCMGFRPPQVDAALKIVDRELAKLTEPWKPRRVFLFSGHMIDAPDREEPRFPKEKEKAATGAIAAKLEEVQAGEGDLAICGGACGGDIIFAEAALRRGLRLNIRIPFEEAEFLENSVRFAGESWVERYVKLKASRSTRILVMPHELGPTPQKVNPYERNNLWELYDALSWGPGKVVFIALWDGKATDRRGGTSHMCENVKKRAGDIHIIHTESL
jgi:hypothetical protein